MSLTQSAAKSRTAKNRAGRAGQSHRASRALDVLVRTVAPIVFALVASGLMIAAMGADPLSFFADVVRLGLLGQGWQHTLTAMAPLLLVALGLIIAFRAQLWNLSYAGTYVLAAAIIAGVAPDVMAVLPFGLAILVLFAMALAVGAAVALVPALLKTRFGINEVVTSLMVSFITISGANLLIRGVLKDPAVSVPQTRVLDLQYMLPYVPGTRVHVGVVIALVMVVLAQVVLTQTAFGLRIDVMAKSPAAALHAGIDVKRLTIGVFVLSGMMIALAAAVDMLGLWGYSRAAWNPGYGDKILPFVFLARLSPLAAVPLVGFYALLATGGAVAAQRAGLSIDVLSVFVALVLFCMLAVEFAGRRRPAPGRWGHSYLRTRGGGT